MNRQPSAATRPPARPGSGRVYAFLVIALATIVIGLTVGPYWVTSGRSSDELPGNALVSIGWSQQQLYVLFGISAALGVVGAFLVGLGRRKNPLPMALEPQRIAGATGLPIVGELFAAQTASARTSPFQWIVFPAELILIAAVLLSFHAAVTKPAIARQFIQDPFAAYRQSVQDWHAQIVALRER